jgi:DNA helicase-2/ATP-dependent DNA helicase PcrA
LNVLIQFAGQLMTNVGAPELLRRIESLNQGRARNAPSPAETGVLAFKATPSFASAATALEVISQQDDVRVYRPAVLRACVSALRLADLGACSFEEATVRAREQYRHNGRPLSRRAVGSTLLLKGLEADVAVILNPDPMDAKHLYVALTRGARQLVVCSQDPVLAPRR